MQIGGYEKGMVKLAQGCSDDCENWEPEHQAVCHSWCVENGEVFLPHSCDEWIVGGKEQVKQMIEDLQEILIKIQ